MPRYGMVIDLDRCTGCRACMVACKVENNTPEAAFWMYVFRLETGEYPNTEVDFLPRPCQHCDNPPCVKVCPVGARYKRDDGLVATDWQRCIGCRYCEVACPYGVNAFNYQDPKKGQYLDWDHPDVNAVTDGAKPPYKNPDLKGEHGEEQRKIAGSNHIKGVMDKCTFCVQRIERGLKPACVDVCPAFALYFGDLSDPNGEVSRKRRDKPVFRLLDEQNTRPRVFYQGTPPTSDAREIERPSVRP